MKIETVQRIVRVAAYIGLAVQLATLALWIPSWSGRSLSGTGPMATATAVMIVTLGLQLLVVMMPIVPNGRAAVSVGKLGPDGWSWIIVSTMLPGALWHYLAGLAASPMRYLMTGFVTPLFLSAALYAALAWQQRRGAQPLA